MQSVTKSQTVDFSSSPNHLSFYCTPNTSSESNVKRSRKIFQCLLKMSNKYEIMPIVFKAPTFSPVYIKSRLLSTNNVIFLGGLCGSMAKSGRSSSPLCHPLSTLNNSNHTLHTLLPPQSIASQHYHLRKRNHDRQLPTQTSHLCNKNFITRALHKDCY